MQHGGTAVRAGARPHQPYRKWRRDGRRLALGRRTRYEEDAVASEPGDGSRGGYSGAGPRRGRDQSRRPAQTDDVLRWRCCGEIAHMEGTMRNTFVRIVVVL